MVFVRVVEVFADVGEQRRRQDECEGFPIYFSLRM